MSFKEKVTLKDVAIYSADKIHIDNINKDNYISTENLLSNYGGKIISSGLPNVKTVSEYKMSDVLISNIRPYFKKIWRAKFDGGASNDVLVIRAKENIIPEFLYYNLANNDFFDYVMSGTKGTKMPRGDKKHIMDFEINLPPIPEQKAIAHILSTLDEKIEVNNKINKTLENMAQSIFKEWFVDFEFPNEEGEPYKSSGGEMIESELGMIPKGWEVIEFGNIVRISSKSVKPMENKSVLYEHYSIPALDEKTYPKFELGDEIKSNKFVVFSDSILISKLNPGTKRIWRPFCISTNSVCSTEFINFIPIRNSIHEFAYGIIDSNEFSDFLINHATGSTGSRQRVKPNDALKFKLVYPNNQNVLTKHFETSKNIYDKINNNIVENQKLTEIRDSLLPKLMSGEIRVPF